MTKHDFLEHLKELLEAEDIDLSEDTELKNSTLFEFDSITVMTLVALIHEKFNKKFSAKQINSVTTIQSLIDLIGLDNFEQ